MDTKMQTSRCAELAAEAMGRLPGEIRANRRDLPLQGVHDVALRIELQGRIELHVQHFGVLAPPLPQGCWGRAGPRVSAAQAPLGPGWGWRRCCACAAARSSAEGHTQRPWEPALHPPAMGCQPRLPHGQWDVGLCKVCLGFTLPNRGENAEEEERKEEKN